jgi:DNA-binding NarL/FixJ family response regulator
MIRIAIVDDQPVARYGLRSILATESDIQVVTAVSSFAELPETMTATVICDPFPLNETSHLNELRAVATRRPVLVVTHSCQPGDFLLAIHAGARGYLAKTAAEDEYAPAIRLIAEGGTHIPAQILRTGVFERPATSTSLSEREQLALAYIAHGFTHQQTATRMGLSRATVDTYVSRARVKLGVGNKAQLALAAFQHVEPALLAHVLLRR